MLSARMEHHFEFPDSGRSIPPVHDILIHSRRAAKAELLPDIWAGLGSDSRNRPWICHQSVVGKRQAWSVLWFGEEFHSNYRTAIYEVDRYHEIGMVNYSEF
jgi:hypothetical protein